MTKRTQTLLAAVLAAVLAASSPAWAADEKGDQPVKGELPPRLRLLKTDFDRLVKLMLEAAQVLEKNDAEAARSLREAVDLAQRAFIAENLAQAAAELEKGLAGKAMTIQNDVGKDLDELIRLLRYGTLGLEEKLRRIENYKDQLARIEKHIAQEKEQREIARAKQQAEKTESELAAHARALAEIVAGQKDLHEKAGQMKPADGAMEKALALRTEVRNLLVKQQVLREKTQTAAMPRLTKAGVIQEIMGDRAGALGKELEAAGKDSSATDLAHGAAEAAGKVVQAGAAMKQAAGAMGAMDRAGGLSKQDEAIKNLTEADQALTKAIEGSPAAGAAAELAARQDELGKKADQLAQAVQATAQAAGGQADTGKLAEASGQMRQASGKLSEVQPAAAKDHMAKALEALKDEQAKLASLSDSLKKKAQTPTDKQAEAQKNVASEAGKTAAGMKGADGSKASPGQGSVEKASGQMGKAAEQIAQNDQAAAEGSQGKALEELAQAKDELERAIEEAQAQAQAEQLAQMERLLTKVLEGQKELSKATVALHKKNPGQDKSYARPEQLELARLATGEGKLSDDVDEIRGLLKKEGTTTVFPVVLQEVRTDMRGLKRLLDAQEAGPFVQSEQTDVEVTLEEMIASLRKEQARRGKKDAGGGGGGGGNCGKKQALVPPVAELKLLRTMEQQIAERTTALDKERSAAPAVSNQLAEQHKELAQRQGKLANLTNDMAEKTKKAAAEAATP